MEDMNLKSKIKLLRHNADWLGLRQVFESQTFRTIRDSHPIENFTSVSEGIMIEVLLNGQFAYAATSNMSEFSATHLAPAASVLSTLFVQCVNHSPGASVNRKFLLTDIAF